MKAGFLADETSGTELIPRKESDTPGIATALTVTGAIAIVGSGLCLLAATVEGSYMVDVAVAEFLCGMVMFALSFICRRVQNQTDELKTQTKLLAQIANIAVEP
jgi:hypothetical protein